MVLTATQAEHLYKTLTDGGSHHCLPFNLSPYILPPPQHCHGAPNPITGQCQGAAAPTLAQTKSYYNGDPDSSLYLQKLLLQGTLREIMVVGFIR